jgi:hypothetical protein
MLAHSSEFENVAVREEELPELDSLALQQCPFDVRGGPENKHGKVNILLQVMPCPVPAAHCPAAFPLTLLGDLGMAQSPHLDIDLDIDDWTVVALAVFSGCLQA